MRSQSVRRSLHNDLGSGQKVVISEMLLSNDFEDYCRKSKVNKFLCQSEDETLIV